MPETSNSHAFSSSSTIHIAHVNICSLRNKVHEIHKLIYANAIHILCITETHLDQSVSNCSLNIPNYSLYRRDSNLHGGGACIYASSQFRVTPVLSKGFQVECITINVHLPTKPTSSIAISCVYRPPSSGVAFWDQLRSELDEVLQSTQHILLGDFNTDVLNRMEKTCFDRALVHSGCPVVNTNVLWLDRISDHDPVLLQCTYQTRPLTKNRFRLMRKLALGSVDFVKCSEDLKNELHTLPDASQLNCQACTLSSSLHTVLNRYAPLCHVRVPSISKPRQQPWVTPSQQNLLPKRIIHRKVRKHPNDCQLFQSYRSCRREGTLLNKRLKTAHCFHLFKAHRRNPKGQWMMLNQLAGRNTVHSVPKASFRDLTSMFADLVWD